MTGVKLVDHATVVYRVENGRRVGAVYRRHDQSWYGQRRDEKKPRLHAWATKPEAVAWLEADDVTGCTCRACASRTDGGTRR